jgi:MtN3 and saliva related transmembrane protein
MPHHAAKALAKSKKQKKRDRFRSFMIFVAVVEPLTTLPQIYQVWVNNQVAGVSLLTWSLYVIVSCIWIMYGIKIKDTPVLVASFLWFITEILVVLGVIFN